MVHSFLLDSKSFHLITHTDTHTQRDGAIYTVEYYRNARTFTFDNINLCMQPGKEQKVHDEKQWITIVFFEQILTLWEKHFIRLLLRYYQEKIIKKKTIFICMDVWKYWIGLIFAEKEVLLIAESEFMNVSKKTLI